MTIAICVTVLLCLVIGVGGFLSYHGGLGAQFFSILQWTAVGIGLLGTLARVENANQKTAQVAETVAVVEKQTNGTNTRLQLLAERALAALEPGKAAEIQASVDPVADTPGSGDHGPDDGGYYSPPVTAPLAPKD